MPILIGLLVIIIVILIFGPVVAGLFALLAAAVGGVVGAVFVAGFALICGLYLIGAAGWCIWYLVDRKAAMASLREAEQRQAAQKRQKLASKR